MQVEQYIKKVESVLTNTVKRALNAVNNITHDTAQDIVQPIDGIDCSVESTQPNLMFDEDRTDLTREQYNEYMDELYSCMSIEEGPIEVVDTTETSSLTLDCEHSLQLVERVRAPLPCYKNISEVITYDSIEDALFRLQAGNLYNSVLELPTAMLVVDSKVKAIIAVNIQNEAQFRTELDNCALLYLLSDQVDLLGDWRNYVKQFNCKENDKNAWSKFMEGKSMDGD